MSWISSFLGEDAAKQSGNLTNNAIDTATDIYGTLAPVRAQALSDLTTTATPEQLAAEYGANPTYQPINSPLVSQSNADAAQSLSDLTSSPDELAMAKTALADFQAQAAPQLQTALRGVATSAGEAGRIGAEGVTTSEGDLGAQYAQNLEAEENSLISSALDKTQANKLADLSAIEGVGSQAYGEASNDRATQDALAEQGITNTMNERGQGNALGLSLADLGYSQSPVSTYQAGAKTYADQAAADAAAAGNLFGAVGAAIAG